MSQNSHSRLPTINMPAARPSYINFEVIVFLRFTTEVLTAVERYFGKGPHFGFKAFIDVPYLYDSNYDKLMNSLKSAVEQFVVNSLDLDSDDVMVLKLSGDEDDWEEWEEITGYDQQVEAEDSKMVSKGALPLPAFRAQLLECEKQNETMNAMAARVMREYRENKTNTQTRGPH